MDFKDYQKASLKHLTTCRVMLDSIQNLSEHSTALINNESKKKALLHNMFYLSGYTLESIINYTIYKHFNWKLPTILDVDHGFSEKCGLSFNPRTATRNGKSTYRFWVSQHEFKRNIQILQKVFSTSKVPLIDRSIKVDKDLVKLFNLWEVEIRYHPENNIFKETDISEDSIKRFVILTETIYNNLMKIVG